MLVSDFLVLHPAREREREKGNQICFELILNFYGTQIKIENGMLVIPDLK